MATHPIQRRYQAEDLVRLRRADEQIRTAASQRQGRIDPNPHQIDAVIFALRRIPEGGCILADEVGLGKTIEAGLVLAQLRAEGARRILIIVPKSLLGQWQEELRSLFGLDAREATLDPESLSGPGIHIVGRELAGSIKGSAALTTTERFDLCVIDEAHEIFAGIHKRYDASGDLKEEATDAIMAHRVRSFLGSTPVLLLTATPIQNSLAELWGLVQYVEPTGTLLGDLRTFRDLFCDGDDRRLIPGQEHELRRRLASICQRTLRRQAQEFLEQPFVDRRCLLFEYPMSAEEKALYDDVTEYLLEPSLCAFAGRQRQLLLIAFHRMMGSSVRALAAGLQKVADRLRALLSGNQPAAGKAFASDLEDDDLDDDDVDAPVPTLPPERIRAELDRVQGFIARAQSLPGDSKAGYLLQALDKARERLRTGHGSGKAVIFTESLATQEYIRDALVAAGWPESTITVFRGQNDSRGAEEALSRWSDDIGRNLPRYKRLSRDVAVRTALVHEFRTRTSVFISTEAGAKGLNLQFCDMVINYDLPWNPQRIEQRIGRCHRYGQLREVTVVNFLAKDNEAHRLLHEILSQKLDLFGRVLDASDHILHEAESSVPSSVGSEFAVEFESQLRRIYERSRSRDEIVEELKRLRETVVKRKEDHDQRLKATEGLIESRFDSEVRHVFRRLQEELPVALASFDRGVDRLVTGYLEAIGVPFKRIATKDRITFELPASSRLPDAIAQGGRFTVGDTKRLEGHDPLHLGHPLVEAAVREARIATEGRMTLQLVLPPSAPGALQTRRGRRGRLVVAKVTYAGLEPVEHLLSVTLFEGDPVPLLQDQAAALMVCAAEDRSALSPPLAIDEQAIQDALDEAMFFDQTEVEQAEQNRFERSMEQIERYAEDRARVLRKRKAGLEQRLTSARVKRDAALAMDARDAATRVIERLEEEQLELDGRIAQLEARDDEKYRTLRAALQQRRYAPTHTERIIDAEFVLS